MLVFHQCLWFGSSVDHSLISNFQVRSNGIVLSDDPFDKARPFGISDPDTGVTMPFTMKGAFAGCNTRCPTLEEYQDCPNVLEVTSDAVWDPSNPSGAQVAHLEVQN